MSQNSSFQDIEIPDWFHPYGTKIRVKYLEPEHLEPNKTCSDLVLVSTAVKVSITQKPDSAEPRWLIKYEILHSKTSRTENEVEMTTACLKRAFGIDEETQSIPRLNLVSAQVEPNVFIRLGDYLNIPNPGNGHDHNENVSILITNHMRHLLRHLLSLE